MAFLARLLSAAAGFAALAAVGSVGAQEAELPEGPGKATFVQVCTQCHMAGMVAERRRDPDEWREVIGRMTEFGAVGTAAEFQAVLAYLNANFGTQTSAPAAARPQTEVKPDAR